MKSGSTSLALCTEEANAGGQRWVHLLPLGSFQGRDGRGPYHLKDAASLMMNSQVYAGSRKIPVDYEHQTDLAPQNGKPAPAAGWIDALQARESGVWGRVTWTETASNFIKKHEYRYLSPVFNYLPDGTVTRILRAALTNNPNLNELTALARAETAMNEIESFLSQLRTLLGLPEQADPADILKKVEEILSAAHSGQPDPKMFVPIGVFEGVVSEVNRLNQGISRNAAEAHVAYQIQRGNMPPALRDWAVNLCTVNKVAYDAFVEKTRGGFNSLVDRKPFNGVPEARHTSGRLSEDEQAICSRMGVSEADYAKARAFNAGRE